MEILIGMVTVMAFMVFISIAESRSKEKKIRNWIHNTYGEVPEKRKNECEDISAYWKEIRDQIPEDEKIDDITWNDLEMDKVFDRINSTKSFNGEQILYARLHNLSKDPSKLRMLEKGIQWCASHEKEREALQYQLCKLGKERVSYYIPMFLNDIDIQRVPHVWVFKLLQGSLIFFILLAGCLMNPALLFIAAGNFLVNIAIYSIMKSRYEVYMETLGGIINTVKFCQDISEGGDYPAEFIPDNIRNNINTLKKLSDMLAGMRRGYQMNVMGDLNAILQDYLQGGTLLNITRYDKVIRILEDKHKEFMELFVFTGEIDLQIAISSYRHSLDEYCIPEFVESKQLIMREIYHPLVEHPVKNTLEMKRNIILTGSNASGKSTFIKTIAINMISAQSINTCMAQEVRIPDAQVITSMSIRDDIVGGESYYMREIKYLKRIVEMSACKRKTICTIDEILRGTNTAERVAASLAVMHYLNKMNCLVLVATHDLELARKLKESCDMYFFSETLLEDDVVFDYKLKKGICASRNAINLLSLIQFPEEIVVEAKKLVII